RDCRGKGVGEDRVHLTANQLGREGWQAIILVRMLQLDNYIAPFDIAQIVQALAERFQVIRSWWSSSAQPSDPRYCRLLCARGNRPCRRTAENGDEVASSHCLLRGPGIFNSGHQNRKLRPAKWGSATSVRCRNQNVERSRRVKMRKTQIE